MLVGSGLDCELKLVVLVGCDDPLVCVKKAQSCGLLSRNAPEKLDEGQMPPLSHGFNRQQPQKVGLVPLHDQNFAFGDEHSWSWRLLNTWPPSAVLLKAVGTLTYMRN
jgi:hypothetical protein